MENWPFIAGDTGSNDCIPIALVNAVLRELVVTQRTWSRVVSSSFVPGVGNPVQVASAGDGRVGIVLSPSQGMVAYWGSNKNIVAPSSAPANNVGLLIPTNGVMLLGPEAIGDIWIVVGTNSNPPAFTAGLLMP